MEFRKGSTYLVLYLVSQLIWSSAQGKSNRSPSADSLSIGWEAQVRSFDPRAAVDANSQYLEDLIHCSLISFDPKGRSQVSLANSPPNWKDPKHLTVDIRPGIKFSHGKIVDVDDVLATYQSLLQSDRFPRSLAFKGVANIKKTGDHQITFTLKEPDATFVSNLVIGILPKEIVDLEKPDQSKFPGCGPFVIESQEINEIKLKRNPFYNLGDIPKINHLSIKIVKSEKTRFAKLRAGELDMAQNNINRDLIDDVKRKYPELEVLTQEGLKTTYLGFNMKDTLAGNLKVRQAIAHAIDRPSIIKLLLGGLATSATSMMTPESEYFNETLRNPEFNLEKANQLLNKAGYPLNGKYRFKISYKTTVDATRINIARAIASQLKKIGINVVIEPMEWGRFKQDIEQGRVQMWSLTWVGFKDPDILRYAFSSQSFPPNGGNRGYYSNQKLDDLLNQGRMTIEIEQRKAIYNAAQQILNEEMPYIFLWHEQNFAIINRRIKGFKLYADGRLSSLVNVFFKN